jgi:hypothetical protein
MKPQVAAATHIGTSGSDATKPHRPFMYLSLITFIYAIRRRPGRRRPFEVRWRAAGTARSKSFLTRALVDSYRAELVRAARTGLEPRRT